MRDSHLSAGYFPSLVEEYVPRETMVAVPAPSFGTVEEVVPAPSCVTVQSEVQKIVAKQEARKLESKRVAKQVHHLEVVNVKLREQVQSLQVILDSELYAGKVKSLESKERNIQNSSETLQLQQRSFKIREEHLSENEERHNLQHKVNVVQVQDALSVIFRMKSTIPALIDLQTEMLASRDEFLGNRTKHSIKLDNIRKDMEKSRVRYAKKMEDQWMTHSEHIKDRENKSRLQLEKMEQDCKVLHAKMKREVQEAGKIHEQRVEDSKVRIASLKVEETAECSVCMDDFPIEQAITCGTCDVDICSECLMGTVRSRFESPFETVKCIGDKCESTFSQKRLSLHLTEEDFQMIHEHMSASQTARVVKLEVDKERLRLSQLSKIDTIVEQVINELTLRCPNCDHVVYKWDGCSAVQCGNESCRVFFCGCCFGVHGNDGDIHRHVPVCSRYGEIFHSKDQLDDIHSLLKVSRVKACLDVLDDEMSKKVFEICMVKKLFDGNILPGDMRCLDKFMSAEPEPEMREGDITLTPDIQRMLDAGEINIELAWDMAAMA